MYYGEKRSHGRHVVRYMCRVHSCRECGYQAVVRYRRNVSVLMDHSGIREIAECPGCGREITWANTFVGVRPENVALARFNVMEGV
jgi:hypothetical protein